MKLKRLAFLVSYLLSAYSLISCKAVPQQEAIALDQANLNNLGGSLTKEFFTGLSSAPGSPARKRSGEILENVFQEKLYPQVPKKDEPYEKESQEHTHHVLNLTIEYLKAGNQCNPTQRIRAYRGLGSQNLLIHPEGQPEQGFHVFADWGTLLTDELKGGIFSGNAIPGVHVFQRLGGANKSAIEQLNWPNFFGMGRLAARSNDPNNFIDFNWEKLAKTHSGSSSFSPLISFALKPDVSDGFGPGFLIVDICPERVLPLENYLTFGETEIYVPLFVLPEEIVRVEGLQCGLDIQNGKAKRESCYPKPLTDSDAPSSATQRMRECYINFGHPIEYKSWGARDSVSRRFFAEKLDILNQIFLSKNLTEARQAQTQVLQQCAASCTVANDVVRDARESLSQPPTNDIDKKNKDLLNQSLSDYLMLMKSKCPTVN